MPSFLANINIIKRARTQKRSVIFELRGLKGVKCVSNNPKY
jgi:hypothetical protein